MRLAVVGGGIAGLAAAWQWRDRGEVTVFEADRVGGRILTTEFCGRPVDEGPDAFLTRVPGAVSLCAELGLSDELVAPAVGGSAIWSAGRMHPLPEGLVLGVPRQLGGLLRSRILSPVGVARAGLDLVLPRRRPPGGLTVRQLVADRFGTQVADRLVDPLVGGIHAGWTGELGASEVTPQLVAVAERSRSLLLGLRHAPAGDGGPMFLTPRPGLGRLVEVLVESLRAAGVRFVDETVPAVRPAGGGAVFVDPDGTAFDAAVIATPAAAAAHLVGAGDVADGLGQVPTASVALLTASLSSELPPGLNGFLVPRAEGRLMTACSFASNKWPHWSADDRTMVRISAGRHGQDGAMGLDDSTLEQRLIGELEQALGRPVTVEATRISRWPGAFPQYLPGHAGLVESIEAALARTMPGVVLAGSSYRGSGIPACISSGRRAADIAAPAPA